MNRLRGCLFLVLFVFSFEMKAQETMMTEISYPFLEKLIALAKQNYPRVASHNALINIAETNVKKARISWFEILNFIYYYSPKTGSSDLYNPYFFNRYQLGINLNIGSILEKPSQIKIAKYEAENARLQKDEYFLNLEALVKQRYFTYIQQLTILKLRMQSAQDAEIILQSVRSKYEKGEETFEHYSTALAAFSNQNQEKISAETDMLIAKVNLEELIVKKLEEVN